VSKVGSILIFEELTYLSWHIKVYHVYLVETARNYEDRRKLPTHEYFKACLNVLSETVTANVCFSA